MTKRRVQSWAMVLLLLGIGWVGTGCSAFHGAWKEAGRRPSPAPGLEGQWEGQWRSDYNGHHGRLRCLITRQSEEVYEAWFHARYAKIFSFAYKTTLDVTPQGDHYLFQGEKDLGRWGVYSFEGRADADQIFSTYRFEKDYGSFGMSRPQD